MCVCIYVYIYLYIHIYIYKDEQVMICFFLRGFLKYLLVSFYSFILEYS